MWGLDFPVLQMYQLNPMHVTRDLIKMFSVTGKTMLFNLFFESISTILTAD